MSDAIDERRRECEEALCVATIAEPQMLVEVGSVVSQEDFRDAFLGWWFRCACELHEAGELTRSRLRSELRGRGMLAETGEVDSFLGLCRQTVTEGSVRYYANSLAAIAGADRVRAILSSAIRRLDDIDPKPDDVADMIRSQLDSATTKQAGLWEQVGDVAEKVLENHRLLLDDPTKNRLGLATGFPTLDEMTGGYFPGQLWQVAARSYMGKSTVALSLAQQQMERGVGVYFASYEMNNPELMERMFADKAAVPLQRFTQGTLSRDDISQAEATLGEFKGANFLLDDSPPDTVAGLKARVRLAAYNAPIQLVIVDHLLLFPHQDRSTPRHQQLVEITRDLKRMAKDCETTVLILNQLNADAEGAAPTNRHFSESKGVLQNLDVNILLHREDNSSEDMLFNVTKNRKGASGEIRMKFFGEIQRVEEYGASVKTMNNFDPLLGMVEASGNY